MIKKILVVFGTRPEAIKLAPIIKFFKSNRSNIKITVCITGQHRKMTRQVLEIFNIKPDYNLDLMKKNQSLFEVMSKAIIGLERILSVDRPNLVLVQGDTSTTLAASLAAYYMKIKIGHIEAGLRTGDKYSPFPEEMNRRLTDCISDIYFVHTKSAKENLIKEGIEAGKIHITGNTVIDAMKIVNNKLKIKKYEREIERIFKSKYEVPEKDQKWILITCHRRESFGEDFENICYGIKNIAINKPDVQLIYPVHLNPNVQKPVWEILSKIKNIHLIEPLDYFSFIWLMRKSYLILTDSGGIQEEAPAMKIPVLVIRKKTERGEGITCGLAKIVGTNKTNIYKEAIKLIENKKEYKEMKKASNPYGDGRASERIYNIIEKAI